MLLSAVSVLVVAQSSSEIPEGLMNNPVYQVALVSLPAHLALSDEVKFIIAGRGVSVMKQEYL